MPFNTVLTRALGIRGRLSQFKGNFLRTDDEQCPLFRVVCNGLATQRWPALLAMLAVSDWYVLTTFTSIRYTY